MSIVGGVKPAMVIADTDAVWRRNLSTEPVQA
jgi:hypothetical protein